MQCGSVMCCCVIWCVIMYVCVCVFDLVSPKCFAAGKPRSSSCATFKFLLRKKRNSLSDSVHCATNKTYFCASRVRSATRKAFTQKELATKSNPECFPKITQRIFALSHSALHPPPPSSINRYINVVTVVTVEVVSGCDSYCGGEMWQW